MNIELNETLYTELETLADSQKKSVGELVEDAVIVYLAHHAKEKDFRAKVREVISEHQWLLHELSKR